MHKNSLENSFREFCHSNKFEINNKQLEIVKSLEDFLNKKKKLISFFSQTDKQCFYLYGNVGVGKTMIVSQVYEQVKTKKLKVHFNEFMVNFHDFRHEKSEENSITKFAKNFLNGIRLVVDLSNGATCSLTPEILRSFGAEVFEINNGNGMINHQCGSEFVQRLQEEVKAQKAHLGFAHDGDGDRVVFVDENGTEVEGDQILGILTIENHHNKSLTGDGLVATIHSNSGLSETLKRNDLSLHRTDVGDRNVYLEMKKLGCNWGGESSGHIICTDYLNTGDGLFAALSVLNCFISSEFENFSKYCQKVKLWPSKSGAVEVMQKTPIENLAGLQDCLQEINKKLGENGRTLVRYSGTEPKLRILVEARNKNLVNEAYAKIYETVSKI